MAELSVETTPIPGLLVELLALSATGWAIAATLGSATGGPDLTRRIFPVVVSVTAAGAVRWSDDEVGVVTEAVVAGRMLKPGG